MLVFLAFVGIVAGGWREVFGPAARPGLGKLFLFLLALTYVLGGAGGGPDRGRGGAGKGGG
jgi:hypothetical protein